MALELNTSTPYGIIVNSAYHRVENITIQNKNIISFYLRSYADKEKQFFLEKYLSCGYLLDGENPIKQAYKYLKTLPEFNGASDC